MPNYLRAHDPGGTFFFTLVTERRRPILTTDLGRQLLSDAMRVTLAERPAIVQAMVLLPDHLHAVWTLPPGDTDYSMRWSLIKRRFAREWLRGGGDEQRRSESRVRVRRRGVWQRRFWEHLVRAHEFEEIAAYLHMNPVKHGVARCPHAWPWSTFHRWVEDGRLKADWRCACDGGLSGSIQPPAFPAWLDHAE